LPLDPFRGSSVSRCPCLLPPYLLLSTDSTANGRQSVTSYSRSDTDDVRFLALRTFRPLLMAIPPDWPVGSTYSMGLPIGVV